MKLIFGSTTLEYLAFFNDKDEAVCTEFCDVATSFLKQGVNVKLYSTAAAKIGVDPDVVKNAVEAIMNVLIEATKINAKETELRESLSTVLPYLVDAIVFAYTTISSDLRHSLDESTTSDVAPEYKSLSWRLEVEVASRSAQNIYRPVIALNLATTTLDDKLSGEPKVEEHLLQTDVATLVQMTQELEDALKEVKTREYRKLTNQVTK